MLVARSNYLTLEDIPNLLYRYGDCMQIIRNPEYRLGITLELPLCRFTYIDYDEMHKDIRIEEYPFNTLYKTWGLSPYEINSNNKIRLYHQMSNDEIELVRQTMFSIEIKIFQNLNK